MDTPIINVKNRSGRCIDFLCNKLRAVEANLLPVPKNVGAGLGVTAAHQIVNLLSRLVPYNTCHPV